MALENFRYILYVTATIFTIIQCLTGMIVCLSIRRKGASENISGFPFIAGVLSFSFWVRYGMMVIDTVMVVVNFVGLVLQFSSVVMFYYYASTRDAYRNQALVVFCIITCTMVYVAMEPGEDSAKDRLGLICCASTILLCAAPLASLGEVLRTRSAETLPYYLIVANVLVAGLGFLYGISIHKSFIQIPNLIGCLIAAFQLTLFFLFPTNRTQINVFLVPSQSNKKDSKSRIKEMNGE